MRYLFARLSTLLITVIGLGALSFSGVPAPAWSAKGQKPPRPAVRQTAEQRAERLNGSAVDLLLQKQYIQAEKLLRTALHIAPRYADTYANLGSVLWEQDKAAEAEKILRAGVKLEAEPIIKALMHYNLAEVLFGTKRFEAAANEYRAALKLNADDKDSRTGLLKALSERGITLGKVKRWRDAEAVWREMLRLDPQNAELQYQLAFALAGQGKHVAAEPLFRKSVGARPDTEIYTAGLVMALVAQKKTTEAEPFVRRLIAQRWKEAFMRRTLAMILMRQGQYQAAESELRRTVQLEPRNALSYAQLANCLVNQHRHDEARTAARKARGLGLKNDKTLEEVERRLALPMPTVTPVPVAP